MNKSTVCILGLGYIGLPTAAMFASKGVNVVGVDTNIAVVDTINAGQIHIIEPGLQDLVALAISDGYLIASTIPVESDVYIICVPTPFYGDHQPDLTYVKSACGSIAPFLKKDSLVIVESTSPVGTTLQVCEWLSELQPNLDFPHNNEHPNVHIAYCPERVLPGNVMRELVDNDRIIGGMTDVCAKRSVEIYSEFVKGEFLLTDAKTAELAKLTENSFRDVNIAFANELSLICDNLAIDVWELIALSNRHPRVNVLNPGAGVGGHCIAVDPWFIVDAAPEQSKLIKTARLINDHKPVWVVDKIKATVLDIAKETDKPIGDIVVACFGLTFKPDIDDLRESPALQIFQMLESQAKYTCLAVDPNVKEIPNSKSQASLVSCDYAIEMADLCVVLVAHSEFSEIIWDKPHLRNRTLNFVGPLKR